MKKILLLFLMLCFALPTWANFEILETTFVDETSFSTNYGTTEYYGNFLIKGIWADNKLLNRNIMAEEIFCQNSKKECISSTLVVGQTNFLDTYINVYNIIDRNKHKYTLYSSTTGSTIKVDLKNKTASKYKVFENGDVNNYYFISDLAKANNYIKTLFN
jgi:hypothetical protein